MTPTTRTFHPVLTSAGPAGGMIAFAFATVDATLTLSFDERGDRPTHAGQRAVDHFLLAQGVQGTVQVDTDLAAELWTDPAWELSLATNALVALRDALPGLSEQLWPEHILASLQTQKLARTMIDGHRVRAAMGPGVHARVDYDGGAVDFDLPDAAMIWIRPPLAPSPRAWTQAQSGTVSVKRAQANAEKLAATLLRAACNDGIAIFQAWEDIDLPESILAAYSGWLPALHAARNAAAHAHIGLVGAGPDMLIVAGDEATASAAAQAALLTFEAHALDCDVHAWSSITEDLENE